MMRWWNLVCGALCALSLTLVTAGCGGSDDAGAPGASSAMGGDASNGGFNAGPGGGTDGSDPGFGPGGSGTGGGDTQHWGTNPGPGPGKPDAETVSQGDLPDESCGQGTIYGLICSQNEQMFVNGADVFVETEDCAGNPIKRSTVSDDGGYYTLYQIPSGYQTVKVEKADWSKEYTVLVKDGMLSDVTGVGHKECFQVVQPCDTGTIWGSVCHEDGTAFVGAQIAADGEGCDGPEHLETTSDGDGKYLFSGLKDGNWTIKVAAAGQLKTYSVDVKGGQTTNLEDLGLDLCVQDDECVPGTDNLPVESKLVTGIADIVWFIDTSGSMKQEAKYVQDNINSFVSIISAAKVDYHVILIAKGFDICVPPPLGGPGCTDGPSFRHIKEKVGSHDGLEKLISTYPSYKDFLRAGATTNFIAVTDDNADKSASWFKSKAASQVGPGFSNPYTFHSIVAYGDIPFVGCIGGAFGGVEYISLTDETGGTKFPICETNWSSVWGKMADTVVDTVTSTCAYALPNPAAVEAAKSVNVTYYKGANGTPINKVSSGAACGAGGGWYLEEIGGQTSLALCPASCDMLQNGVLQVDYDCK